MPNRPRLDERMNDPPACDEEFDSTFRSRASLAPSGPRAINEKPRLKPGLTYLGLFGP
jgi:hypothetical protein